MTYTVLARCPETGRFGMAVGTYSVAVGQWCDGLDRHAGVSMSQAYVRTSNNSLALNLLRLGHSAGYVSDALVRDDEFGSYRQIGVVSSDGKASCHTGESTRAWSGHHIGEGYLTMGNLLSGEHVLHAMAEAFESSRRFGFEERLLRTIEAARDAGGQSNGQLALAERSGALIVTASDDLDAVNIRVDLHDRAVDEVRRVYGVCSQYASYYRMRSISPAATPPQEVFNRQHGIRA